jgi:formylglycine-generating enzyme required for sulfatase activity
MGARFVIILMSCVAAYSTVLAATNRSESRIVRGVEFIKFGPAEFAIGYQTNLPNEWKHLVSNYPSSNVSVGAYWFGKIPTTVEQYCEFLNAKGFKTSYANKGKMFTFVEKKGSRYAPKKNRSKNAIGGVTFTGAVAYCEWFSNVSESRCRLPTSAEWEFVAKGKENRLYPWGNAPTRDFPFYSVLGTRTDLATPEGVFDLIGPVYQWCADDAPQAREGTPWKIVRGGTIFRTGLINERMNVPPNCMWSASRPDDADSNQGFRVVIDP